MYSSTHSSTSVLDGLGGQRHVPVLYPWERDPVPILQKTELRNISPILRFDPWTI